MSLFQAFCNWVAFLCLALATNKAHCFTSIKAPKETISRYESVVPVITPSDGHHLHPKFLQIAIHSQSYNYSLLLEMNKQLISPHFTSRYYNEDGQEVVTKGHVNCFYHGRVVDHPNWKVTMSTCHGLQGAFGDRHDENNYFHLEPLDLENGSLEQVHALYLDSEYQHKTGTCGSDFGSVSSGGDVLWPNLDETQHNIHTRLRRQSAQRIVEWIVVNDNRQYIENNQNLTATVIRAITVANDVDALFRPLNIRVVLVEVITWVNGDEITVSPDPNTLLTRFQGQYRPLITTPYDSLMLLTGIDLTGSTVGFAFVGTMCSETHSVGLTQDGGRNPTSTASTAAHELGHIFNMRHDDGRGCNCVDSETTGCIMSAVLGFPPPSQWSNCSESDLMEGYRENLDMCLFNEPTMTVGDPVCGNGIREGDEVCDCGSPTQCADPCCNPNTCQLATGAQCTAGPCCNSTCHFVSYGTQCRAASGECDIAEYCTGISSDCPTNVHTADGTSCASSTGFCYTGLCPTYNAQCQNAFGSNNGADVCYERINTRGDQFGHCGQNSTNYIPCSANNVQCGQLHCMSGDFQANPGVSVIITTFTIGSDVCRAFTTTIGADVMSPGLVQDGTKCGNDQVCLSQMCVPVSQITTLACETASNGLICSGNGVCNNHGNCSCNVGYVGSDCEIPYSGPDDNVNECAMNNGGCAQICTDTLSSFSCSCNTGYILDSDGLSCRDVDECATTNGNCAQLCNNTVGSFICGCNEGFLLSSDGRSCADINECTSSTHDCAQLCSNTAGSFTCGCNNGYQLSSDGRSCADINECTSNTHDCQQNCINNIGSFDCSCNAGYQLQSDQRSCSDIDECATANGNCAQLCNNTVGSFTCGCNGGYQLSSDGRSCMDINECTLNTHDCEQNCLNTIGSFICSCNDGYQRHSDQRSCSDINECVANTDGCDQGCQNTIGSFQCTCDSGYVLSNDERTCSDIDECLTNSGGCTDTCVNTVGSFRCMCDEGYSLANDGRTCMDVDECSTGTHECQHICENTAGGFRCLCRQGFQLSPDNTTCSDVDECASTHGCQQVCINIDGGFRCDCDSGFELNSDNSTCSDINECATNIDGCSQVCMNTNGSFSCGCNDGYVLLEDGRTCRDIDECSAGTHGCQQDCVNTDGGFRCECRQGFQLNDDGSTCSDIDECTANTSQCSQSCTNTNGSFICTCSSGYSLSNDRTTCLDINECSTETHGCQHICVNTEGAFRCECNSGYEINSDQTTCSDIDECNANTDGCDQICNNTDGSFQCSCRSGFTLLNDEKTCGEVNECTLNAHNCQQRCVNENGGFRCECIAGYLLNADLRTCSDINECTVNTSICDQGCNNTDGSFQCFCDAGYSLSDDGRTCTDVNECLSEMHRCQQDCVNDNGGFRCGCFAGYTLNADLRTCSDIDECAANSSTCGQVCNNTNGSFNCLCFDGYMLSEDGRTCGDVDECEAGLHECQQLCVNTVGGFRCECDLGYELNDDSSTCSDIDECDTSLSMPLSDCDQVCVNTIGGFRCECMAGFELARDNSTCSDIDECADASICDHNCVNINGSFSCFCNEGYTLADDGKTCTDTDECSTDLNRCQQVCVNTDGGFRCDCNSGFQLNADRSTCTDIDECAADTDGCDQMCNNTDGSFQCSCRSGFILLNDGKTCGEVNECTLNTHNCQQQCINEDGGFRCECFAGYSLNADQSTCSDIDECATNSTTCSQVCNNTIGSFNCLCFDGYMLSEDGRTCGDVDECETGLHECQQLCVNTVGGFRCECNPGFELNNDRSTCSDIDECDMSLSVPLSDCDQVCINTIGGFRCECMAGFELARDNSTCSDIDECADTSICDHNCVNNNGSFNCICNEGYTLADNGRTCIDVDECSTNLSGCQQICVNTDGGFRCDCNPGFQLNSDLNTCADIDECTADTDGCDHICNNTEGSYECSCRSGFTLLDDGKTCVEINECTLNTHNCQQQCINEDGGFRCDCFVGYSLNADQRTCSDINECRNNNSGCNQGCNNTDGSFMCTCEDGYDLSDDERTCVDINECTTQAHGCEQACVNMEGQYRCGCYVGYVINNDLRTCSDVNECATETNNCDQLCENTVGSFQCGCNEGYSLNSDGKTCEDINECATDTDNCQQGCTNTVGSFECTCFTGYELNNDRRTCAGTGRIFTLVNSTTALLVEGRSVSICVELVQSTSQPDTLQPLRIIQVTSRTDSQHENASVLEHGDFIDFNSNPDTGIQRVSCVSIGIDEDLVYIPNRVFLVTLQPVESGDRFEGPNQISIEIVENGIKFLDIADQEGTEKLELRSSDGHSRAIYFINGIPVGRSTETRAFVGDNGVISFRRGFTYYRPDLFPTNRQAIRNSLLVTPFWSDADIRLEGEIHYKQFFRTSGIEQEITLIRYISNYIAGRQGLANFTASTLLVAQWKGIPPFPHGSRARSEDVLDAFTDKRNSFQAIIVTDDEQTFAVFTYNCGMLEWTGLFEHAVIGYNVVEGVADEFPRFDNYILSGQPNVNLVACANRERGVEWSNLVYKIGDISGDVIQENRARCLKKYEDDINIFGTIPISLASLARPCPCSVFQAIRDRRFVFNLVAQPRSLTTVCFIQRFRSRGGVVQECCYSTSTDSFGSLLTQSDSSGSTGSLLLFHPYFRSRQYREYDLEFKTLCCYQSDRCSLYYERRPSNDCASYFPPRFTWGWGDPHITTLDGHQYTFNGWGEYVLVKVESQFELQGRTSPFNNSNATMFSAFAFGVAEAIVEVGVDGSNTLSVLLNGTSITSDVGNVNDSISNDYVDITRTEANKITSSFYNDVSVTVTLSTGILNFMAALPHEFMGNTKGLLGNFNQNDTDDLVYPNGTILSTEAGDRMTHLFGQTWEIISSESLFTYPEGTSAESFSHPEHKPVFLDEIIETASDEIRQLCGDNAECIFDAIQTGRTDIALDTLETDITNTNDQMITANDPPFLMGRNKFFVTIGERSYYTFNVSDDHNNFTLAVEGGLPNNASLQINGSLYTLTWTLSLPLHQISNFNKTIQIIAKDELNATALLSPQIQICACGEGGSCTPDGLLNVSTNPLILNCDCSPAYSGRYCDVDVDGCADLSCYEGVDCEDIPAPGIGAVCGPCPDGFDGNGMKCNDIDECANATLNNCQQVCVNSEGGYTCDCLLGYSLINSTHCEDINECAELSGGCHQVCNNVDGSFFCSCTEGYELQSDNITCMASSFCSNTNECDQNCVLLDGVEQCSCDKGYSLAGNGLTCQDVNECQESVCSQLCNNTVGGFECGCRAGFRLGSDKRSCQDIDECLLGAMDGIQLCSNQMICNNTEGNFTCLCPTGTTLVDGVCSEVCAVNYYRLRSTRCVPCPTNSIRLLNENDELCSCINGYGRRQEADADQPCIPIIGFNMEQVTLSEGDERHSEVVHLALSTSSSDEITVTFNVYPSVYMGLVSQEVTFTRGAKTASIVITIEGNMVATDGNRQFSVTVNDGTNYIAGGTLGEDQYYPTLQITVEEDDDLLPEFGANSVIIMLRGFSVATFSAERQQQFKQTTSSVINVYCQTRRCHYIALGQKTRQVFQMVTADDIVLRDLKDNGDQLQFSMFILINNDAAVLSADDILQAIETSQDAYAESGFSSVTGTHLNPPPNPSSTIPSLYVIIGIAIGATAGLSLLLLCMLSVYKCCRAFTRRPKRVKTRTASSDYIIENAQATPWPHEDTALNIDKPHQSFNLQPMYGAEDRYVQWQPERAIL